MANQSNPYLHKPSRGDCRVARQLLADLHEGRTSTALDHLAVGPLGGIIRFFAGTGLTYVFVGHEGSRYFGIAGPAADPVALLIRRLLDDGPSDLPAGYIPASAADKTFFAAVEATRSPWIESAVGQVVDGLHLRDLEFTLDWSLPGVNQVRLDSSVGTRREVIAERLKGFLVERLGVSVCGDRHHLRYKEVASHA